MLVSKPIGITEAAFLAGVTKKVIFNEMEGGRLVWIDDLAWNLVTTPRWLRDWKRTR